MKLKGGDEIKCPECNEPWEGLVEDYVIPNCVGVDSEAIEQCGYCDTYIRVVRDPDGSYLVEMDDGNS